jgi:NO-binding membrane sensor protein with MHYT domain
LGQMEHGTYVPLLAFLVSCLGCGLGLVCTNRARTGTRTSRGLWLAWSAVSIGGTGIWGMHFIGMLGVTVHGAEVRWNVLLTILSLVTAIMVVGAGMFLVSYGPAGRRTLLFAGLITGIGVATMHYTGMAAMRVQGSISYDIPLVGLSVAIAVVAATAALWITRDVRRRLAMAAAVPIMGLAVSGMHYTGMAAANIAVDATAPVPAGMGMAAFVWPLIIWIVGCPFVTVPLVMLAPSGEQVLENRYYQEIADRLSRD